MKPSTAGETVTIGFAGDVMIGRLVNDHLSKVPSKYIWGDMLPFLKGCDLNLINLETALTKNDIPVPKVFNFRADPKYVQTLTEASIDVVTLANNHVLDYGEKGLLETLETLDRAHIKHVGAGKTLSEAKKPAIFTRKGISIGILGFTDNEPSWIATDKRPGINYITITPLDLPIVLKEVEELKKHVDIVIVSLHWGPNMVESPPFEFIQFAHHLIDSGVDIIHGHSAHIFQRVEYYKKGLILYDTGDFIDDYYVDPTLRNDRSFYFMVDVNREGFLALRLIPTCISNFQVNQAQGADKEESVLRMELLSKQ